MDNLAVIDLGTNTFHLLIAEVKHGKFIEKFRERRFVNLAEEGIQKIGNEAYQRALSTVRFFSKKLNEYQASNVRIIGTAALRTASNGKSLIKDINDLTQLEVMIIDGIREAELIFKGVSVLTDIGKENQLIMDIGGGSVEFIIAAENTMNWCGSFPIGVTVLYNRFHNTDPLSQDEMRAIHNFLEQHLTQLSEALKETPCISLIGASGSFEVLQKMLTGRLYKTRTKTYQKEQFYQVYSKLIHSSLQERLKMPRLLKERAKLVVVAFVLIKYIIELTQSDSITVSPYALKEGVLSELINI